MVSYNVFLFERSEHSQLQTLHYKPYMLFLLLKGESKLEFVI